MTSDVIPYVVYTCMLLRGGRKEKQTLRMPITFYKNGKVFKKCTKCTIFPYIVGSILVSQLIADVLILCEHKLQLATQRQLHYSLLVMYNIKGPSTEPWGTSKCHFFFFLDYMFITDCQTNFCWPGKILWHSVRCSYKSSCMNITDCRIIFSHTVYSATKIADCDI